MKNRKYVYLFSVIALSLTGFLFFKISALKDKRSEIRQARLSFSDYKLTDISNKDFTLRQWANGADLLIYYFDPGCDHCHDGIRQIIANADSLSNKKILLLSSSDATEVQKFQKQYDLSSGLPNGRIVCMVPGKIEEMGLSFRITPTYHLFNSNLEEQKRFEGQTEFKNVLKAFRQ